VCNLFVNGTSSELNALTPRPPLPLNLEERRGGGRGFVCCAEGMICGIW